MKPGDKIKITARLERDNEIRETEKGLDRWFKFWQQDDFDPPKDGFFLGYRTVSNGFVYYSSEGNNYEPKEYIKVCLVILADGRTNPFYAPVEGVTIWFTETNKVCGLIKNTLKNTKSSKLK